MYRSTSLIASFVFVLTAFPLAAADDVRHDVSAVLDFEGVTRVVVEVPYAHVTVQNGDASRVETWGYVTRSYRNTKQQEDASAMVADSNVRIDLEGSTAYVRRHLGPNAQSRTAKGSKSMYVIVVRVPAETNLLVRQDEGTITAKGSFATVDVKLSKGDVKLELPKRNVGELIARTRYGLLQVHLGDRIIENEGLMPRKAHYFYEGGKNVLTAMVTHGDITIKLVE